MNWHDRRNTAERHDRERDLRKHEPRMGDNKGLELLAAVEGLLAVPQFVDQFPLSSALFRTVTTRFRADNGMEAPHA